MEFLNKLGNIASETYKKTSKKTGDLAKEAKIRMKMNEDKGKIKDLYTEIGKFIYQKHIDGAEIPTDEEIIGFCKNIDELSEEIEKASDQLLALRGKRVCEHCHAEIDISVKFCPLCGTEQPEIPVEEVSEVEVVEGEENVEETNAEEEIPEAEKVEDEEKTDNEDSSDENA